MPIVFTADESSFQKPKSRQAALFLYKVVADVGAKLALFVITVIAARRLGASAFGVFSLGSTLGWMAAVGADFGMQMHLARAVAREPGTAAGLLTAWLRLRLLTAALSVAVVVVGVMASRVSGEVARPIVLLALVYATAGLVEFINYFYRGLSRSDIESSLTIWQRSGTLVLGLAALAWRPTVATLAIALLIPPLVTLPISLRIAARVSPKVAQPFRAAIAGLKPCATTLARDVAPIGAGILLSALYFRIDVFLVQLWAGTESVALYNAVFRVIEGLRLFPAAALAVALPALCRARDARPLVSVSLLVTAGASLVAAAAWPIAESIVVLLFGAPYAPAAPAFRVLLLSFPLLALNYALTHQLIGWDGQRAYAIICALALAANVALNARLIPAFSIAGAAWATIGTELVVTAGCAVALALHSRWAAAGWAIAEPRLG